jgi:Helix-turn-helix domain
MMSRNNRNLGLFAATVQLLTKAPRSCPELSSLLGSGTRNTVYHYVEVLEAEGLIEKIGYTQPGRNTQGVPTRGPMVYRWIGATFPEQLELPLEEPEAA